MEVNRATTAITGYSRDRLLQMTVMDITAQESLPGARASFETLKTSGRMNAELKYLHQNGSVRWWSISAVRVAEDRYLGFSGDTTEKKVAEANLLYLSYHDYLTDLYNRRFFEDELKRVDTSSQLPLSVLIGDINGVKLVNDAFGHAEGDRLIVECARMIGSCCRSTDTVARTGGDEFCILMPKTDAASAMAILNQIQSTLSAFDASIAKNRFTHSVSMGYATKATADQEMTQVLKTAEEYMYQRKLLEHQSSHSAIISSIKATMLEKSHETEEHAERLVDLAKAVANALGLSQIDQGRLELLATLHDIGKVGISDHILTKPGKLDEAEWEEMKRHPEIGYRIAASSPDLIPVAESILCHHERWDGTGYPQGLSGERIPLLSRIIAVVDAYDAMTQDRAYRKAMTHPDAIAEITRNAGTQFDPHIVEIFIAEVNHQA
ncbi:MAG TPA: diguanylate cyclase [Candidatus Limiplasma sp.]|nr:diguanylate cyclase [Candidatus Limiplasma sp.]